MPAPSIYRQPGLHIIALFWIGLTAVSLSTPSAVFAASSDALIEAAQQGDLAGVRQLLDEGVDVDSKSRYGATALFFAVDKANAEMVDLLLAHGADVNVVDTFYSASPLDWALFKADASEPHRQMLLRLLKVQPESTSGVLALAARLGDSELADAVLALERSTQGELLNAAKTAAEAGHSELSKRFEASAENAPSPDSIEVAREILEGYAGEFKNEEIGLTIKTFLEGDALKAQATGQPVTSLVPTAERTFQALEDPAITLVFRGRGGTVEGLTLQQGGRDFEFAKAPASGEPASEDPASEAPASEEKIAKEGDTQSPDRALPETKRGAARPWPSFRGPFASGVGDGQGAPASWDGASGENVLWKTPIPGIGLSSPVVWGDQVFVTTAISGAKDETFRIGLYGDVDAVDDESEHEWKIYALDRKSGEILWERTAAKGAPQVKRHTKSSHANPTPVTDGRYVVAHFGSEGIYCYTTEGEPRWQVEVPKLVSGWFYDPTYEWGYASSPILHDGLVIVQTDIQKGSYIAAYDLETGVEKWKTTRNEIPTWGTPNVLATDDGAEIITNGTTIRGYDWKTGKEIWHLGPNSEVTVGTPIIGDGVAYVTGGYPPIRPIYAVNAGARGDLTLAEGETSSDAIAWSTNRGGTYIPTPILYDGILYMTHNNGRLTAHDAETGEQLYRARVGTSDSFAGSPIAADGRLYFTNEEGRTYVVRAGETFEELGRNELGEIVMTTPAISDGTFILRGLKHVWALGPGPRDPADASTETHDGDPQSSRE